MNAAMRAVAVAFLFLGLSHPGVAAVPEPLITPDGGHYKGSVSYSIHSPLPATVIHYTTDGTRPTPDSPVFVAGVPAVFQGDAQREVQAIAIAPSGEASAVAKARFFVSSLPSAAMPEISPQGGSFGPSVSVTLSCAVPGASLRYTTDGSIPTALSPLYASPIPIATPGTVVLRAVTMKEGMVDSPVSQATFLMGCRTTAQPPSIAPPGGDFSGWLDVTARSPEPGAVLRYTTDGTDPMPSSTQFGKTKFVGRTTILKVRSFAAGKADSAVVTASFQALDADRRVDVNVADYGAGPDRDGEANRQAVERALQAARNVGNANPRRVRVFFPEGTYRIDGGFSLSGTDNLTVDGQGSVLIFSGKAPPFRAAPSGPVPSCNGLVLENLAIDVVPRPFFSGVVSHVDAAAGTFDLVLDSAQSPSSGVGGPAYLQIDPATGDVPRGGLDVYRRWSGEAVGPRVMRITSPGNLVAAGMYLSLRLPTGSCDIDLTDCDGVLIRNVRLFASGSMGVVAMHCTDLDMEGVSVIRDPERRYPMTLQADGLHLSSCRGEIVVRDCTFEDQGDDGENICSFYHPISAVNGATITAGGTSSAYSPGDLLEFRDPATLQVKGTAVVLSASSQADPPTQMMTLDGAPSVREGDKIVNLTWLPRVTVSRSAFRGDRARGILIQSPNATVENCSFRNIAAAAVLVLTAETGSPESTASRNVRILNNSIDDCNRGGPGAIWVMAGYNPVTHNCLPAGVHRDISIADNTLRNIDGAAITVESCADADVSNNTIVNCGLRPRPGMFEAHNAIAVRYSKQIRVAHNTQTVENYVRLDAPLSPADLPEDGIRPLLFDAEADGPRGVATGLRWDMGLASSPPPLLLSLEDAAGRRAVTVSMGVPAAGALDFRFQCPAREIVLPSAEKMPDGSYAIRVEPESVSGVAAGFSGVAGILTLGTGSPKPIWIDPATTSEVVLDGNVGFDAGPTP